MGALYPRGLQSSVRTNMHAHIYISTCSRHEALGANMVSTQARHAHLLQSSSRSVQHPKVILSKEARAMLSLERKKKSVCFKQDLENAWSDVTEATKKIAATHHKSLRCVQHNLYLRSGPLLRKREKVNAWNAFFWKKSHDPMHLLRPSYTATRR